MEFCLLDPLVGAAAVGAKELVAVDALGAGHLVIVTAVAILTTSYPHKVRLRCFSNEGNIFNLPHSSLFPFVPLFLSHSHLQHESYTYDLSHLSIFVGAVVRIAIAALDEQIVDDVLLGRR